MKRFKLSPDKFKKPVTGCPVLCSSGSAKELLPFNGIEFPGIEGIILDVANRKKPELLVFRMGYEIVCKPLFIQISVSPFFVIRDNVNKTAGNFF